MTAKEYVESLQQKYGQLCQQDSNAMTTTRWASELYKLEARIEVYVLVLEDLKVCCGSWRTSPMADFATMPFGIRSGTPRAATCWPAARLPCAPGGWAMPAPTALPLPSATGSRTAGSTSSTSTSGSSSRAARWTACPANQKGPPVFAARTSPKGDGICKPHHPEE